MNAAQGDGTTALHCDLLDRSETARLRAQARRVRRRIDPTASISVGEGAAKELVWDQLAWIELGQGRRHNAGTCDGSENSWTLSNSISWCSSINTASQMEHTRAVSERTKCRQGKHGSTARLARLQTLLDAD